MSRSRQVLSATGSLLSPKSWNPHQTSYGAYGIKLVKEEMLGETVWLSEYLPYGFLDSPTHLDNNCGPLTLIKIRRSLIRYSLGKKRLPVPGGP